MFAFALVFDAVFNGDHAQLGGELLATGFRGGVERIIHGLGLLLGIELMLLVSR